MSKDILVLKKPVLKKPSTKQAIEHNNLECPMDTSLSVVTLDGHLGVDSGEEVSESPMDTDESVIEMDYEKMDQLTEDFHLVKLHDVAIEMMDQSNNFVCDQQQHQQSVLVVSATEVCRLIIDDDFMDQS